MASNELAPGLEPERVAHVQLQITLAIGMLDELIRQGQLPSAVELGRLGGTETAKRGPDYFRELAARRKTHGGGRPRKDAV